MHHFDKQQQYEFGDVVTVIDAVITQDVTQVPEFLYDIVIGHGFFCFYSAFSDLKESVLI